MHTQDPEAFAALLVAAADTIPEQPSFPGQTIPGLWRLDPDHPYELIIGTIVAAAIARACADRGYDFDKALVSYLTVAKRISLRPVGAPDKMAEQHLRDAADILRVPA